MSGITDPDFVAPFMAKRHWPIDFRPWATWKRENLLATPSMRHGATLVTDFPRFFSALPYLKPLIALRINKRPLSP